MKKGNKLTQTIALTLVFLLIGVSSFAQSATKKEAPKPSVDDLKAYVGEYIYDNNSDFGFDLGITYNKENGLEAEPKDKSQPKTQMKGLKTDTFELVGTNGISVEFNRNKKGEIESLTMSNSRLSFICVKKKKA